MGIAGTNLEGMRKYRRFAENPEGDGGTAAVFAVGNARTECRPPGLAGANLRSTPTIGGSTYAPAVTALSRNDGVFLPIPSEKLRKIGAFRHVAAPHLC